MSKKACHNKCFILNECTGIHTKCLKETKIKSKDTPCSNFNIRHRHTINFFMRLLF